ncbi:MAG: exo-alpha-sialidase [Acidobacteriaceae bacterium]|nr:exo-alpha-sialidase [Acidobacteriaceae bacterium]
MRSPAFTFSLLVSVLVFFLVSFLNRASLLFAQSPRASAPDSVVRSISSSGGHFSEPSIALNPNNPNQLVIVYQGGVETQGSATAAYSRDGGQTFTLAEGTKPADWRVAGDVTTTFDNHGHAFLCYLAFDRLGTTSYWAHNAGRNGIFVRRSLDGGKTW